MQCCSFWPVPYVSDMQGKPPCMKSIEGRIAPKYGGMQLQFFVINPALRRVHRWRGPLWAWE
ncbi:hypothetical protein CSR02_06260 [Acetobacter pomorum]|uniref:Uncharacterized protein n=1 Tax=Acetobacter pomorum TaxID=65959 RepID=A0A2G4RCD7_9PROT|nr:hypothetical protein CSR02_06260 [Acetobacter pomorum]